MPDGRVLVGYVLSAAALLGPVAYILFAFFEMGRLEYFGAPTEFLQTTSLGIITMMLHVYPGLFITALIVGIASGIPLARGSRVLVLLCMCVAYIAFVLWYVALTSLWQWVFGAVFILSGLTAVFIPQSTPEFGNDVATAAPDPVHVSVRHYKLTTRAFAVLAGAAMFALAFTAAGNKQSAQQEYFWVIGSRVVIGFYGDRALTAELSGNVVGPNFAFEELKSTETEMRYGKIGPLKKAPTWQSIKEF